MAPRTQNADGPRRPGRTAADTRDRRATPVVGIGASAGGIKAYQTFVAHLPTDAGIAWVLIQHMAPDRESQLREILERKTSLPVTEVIERTRVVRDHIYLIAPGRTMTIVGGMLKPVADGDPAARQSSIDAFFLSLARDRGPRAGCALLSGAGSDGTLGLKAIKEAGGLTLTQSLDSAEYDSMLLSAIRTGLVDREMPIEDMGTAFARFLTWKAAGRVDEQMTEGDRLRACDLLRASTGHDFSGYKATTIDRRLVRRMQMLGITKPADYLARLQKDNDEATLLFRDMLIGVTQFFRDAEAFTALAAKVVPEVLRGKTADDVVRVWVPGCATGEEVYSIAMMFQEQRLQLESMPEVKIFGSDIDDGALHVARLARYPKGIAADVSPERLKLCFDREDGTYVVRGPLREMCLFALHNVLRDPPFSRIDLLVCRNLLIYLTPELQHRLMPVFHYAMRRNAFLFLGPAENANHSSALFTDYDRAHRIYRRVGDAGALPDFPIAAGKGGKDEHASRQPERILEVADPLSARAAHRILSEFAPAYVIIDSHYDIVEASAHTGAFLELPGGRPNTNLGAMARSGLAVDIRSAVAAAMASGARQTVDGLVTGTGAQRRQLTLVVEPFPDASAPHPLYLVVFREGSPVKPAASEGRARDRDTALARALELELLTTKERLQGTLEELQTSNEELKASNEELSSVNEELQSSNEELETSKEELQSINEELRTVNNELSRRVDEISRANNDLKNLFAATQIAILFLDEAYRIMNFTPLAKPLFGLRDHDIGRPLDELAGRVACGALKPEVRRVMTERKPIEREVESNGDGDGRTYIMRLTPYLDEHETTRGVVLTFIDITERKNAERHLASMVSELNHRVKNSLASVQAIMRQSQTGAPSVREFLSIVEGRLQAMVVAHNLLSENAWKHGDLRQLARTVLAPFGDTPSKRLSLSGPAVDLRPEVTVSMGVVLHEMATNAAKYGAWSTPDGSVSLDWEVVRSDGGSVRVTWAEHGGPPAKEPDRPGFGLRFIRNSVQYEFGGECRPEFGRHGFRCAFVLPGDKIGVGAAR